MAYTFVTREEINDHWHQWPKELVDRLFAERDAYRKRLAHNIQADRITVTADGVCIPLWDDMEKLADAEAARIVVENEQRSNHKSG